MKKIKLAIICALIVSILSTGVVFAANYDSSIDPLITLSYLNEVFLPKINDQISGFTSTVAQINDRVTKLEAGGNNSSASAALTKKVTDLEQKFTDVYGKYLTIDTKLSGLDTKLSGYGTKISGLETKQSGIETKYSELEKKYAELEKKYADLSETVENGGSAVYEVLYVNKGEKILTPTGCEMILRSGTATIVSPFDSQGLSDITYGLDLLNGFDVPANHNLIVPRGNDGRGILVTSDAGAYVMVRGGYTVVKP